MKLLVKRGEKIGRVARLKRCEHLLMMLVATDIGRRAKGRWNNNIRDDMIEELKSKIPEIMIESRWRIVSYTR